MDLITLTLAKNYTDSVASSGGGTSVTTSTTNGNIKINGAESIVYTHPSGTNPHDTTKTDVGLSNVDNTSDTDKPISTATQIALDGKVTNSTTNGNILIDGVETNVYAHRIEDYIFKAGDTCDVLTGGYSHISQGGTIVNEGGYVRLSSSHKYGAGWQTYNSIDLTNYGKLYVDLDYTSSSDTSTAIASVFIGSSMLWHSIPGSSSVRKIVEVDLTNVTVLQTIRFGSTFYGGSSPGWTGTLNIYNAWLEQNGEILTASEKNKLSSISTGANKVIDSATNGNILIDNVETNVYTHPIGTNPHSTTKTDIGLGDVDNTSDLNKPISTATQIALNLKVDTSQKGVANGVAQLDDNGIIPSSQLPSYVDDVLEYTSNSLFPATGESGKIYLNTTNNLTYRWTGSGYAEISPSIALGETSSTAYAGDKGKTTTDKVNGHLADTVSHITSTERTNWNSSSANNHTHSNKTVLDNTTASYTTAEKTKLSGIANNANNYTLPVASTAIGGVKSGTDITIDTGGNVSVNDNSHNHTIGNVGGLQTALDGKVDDSQVLTNVPSGAKFTDTVTTINSKTGAISKADIVALGVPSQDTTYSVFTPTVNGLTPLSGGGTTKYLRADGTWATPPDTSTTYAIATTSANGLMSSADKTKLNGIATGANNYTLPIASATIGGVKSGTDITVDASGNVSINDDSHNHVIANVDGLQAALDGKVDDGQVLTNVPAGAKFTDTVYAHPATHAPSIITQDASNRFVTDTEKATWNGKVDSSKVLTNVPLNAKFTDTVYVHPASHTPSVITQDSSNRFVTDAEKSAWNGKVNSNQVLTNVPANAKFTDTVYTHPATHAPSIITQDASNRFVTDMEKSTWNGKATEYTIDASINSIQIGGRNLLLKSNIPIANAADRIQRYNYGEQVALHDEVYTATIKFELAADRNWLTLFTGGGAKSVVALRNSDRNSEGVASKTFTMKYLAGRFPEDGYTYIDFNQTPNSGTSTSSIEWVKLEKGNKATEDWTPAPEDVDSAIALKADKITNGTTATRPVPTHIGQSHFDTTLGKPIWCKTVATKVWVDSTGTVC